MRQSPCKWWCSRIPPEDD